MRLGTTALVVTTTVLASCTIYPLGDITSVGTVKLNHTFGQLIPDAGGRVAHYAELSFTPVTEAIRAPSNGVISFKAAMDGLSDCLVIRPAGKTSLTERSTAPAPGLPKPKKLRLAFCNLLNSGGEIRATAAGAFAAAGYDDTTPDPDDGAGRTPLQIAADGFMAGDDDFDELAIKLAPGDLAGWSILGQAESGELQAMAYSLVAESSGDIDGNRNYVNPLPYLREYIPGGLFPAQAPGIVAASLEVSTDAAFTAPTLLSFDTTSWELQPDAPVSGFARLWLKLDVRMPGDADGPTVSPYAIAYKLRKVSTGNVLSHGDARMHTIDVADIDSRRLHLYAAALSNPTIHDIWHHLIWDVTSPLDDDPEVLDASAGAGADILSLHDPVNGGQTLPGGEYELEIELRDAFAEPGSGTSLTLSLKIANPEVEFVRDDDGDHMIDGSDSVATHLNVGHWGEDDGGGLDGYDAANAIINNGPPNNFVDKDPRRFYLRVTDETANTTGGQDTVTALIHTTLANGDPDDDPTQITLTETPANDGVFVSHSLLLMSPDLPMEPYTDSDGNCAHDPGEPFTDLDGDGAFDTQNPDDDMAVHNGTTHRVCDDTPGDRTHRVTVDGFVKADYTAPSGRAAFLSTPVCNRDPEERKVLNVAVKIFNEPYEDTNNNHVRDAGERFVDSSNNVFALGMAGTYGPIWSTAEVDTTMAFLASQMAVNCIRVNEVSRTTLDPRDGLFLHHMNAAGTMNAGLIDEFDDDSTTVNPSRDEVIVQTHFRSMENLDGTEDNDVLDIYFVTRGLDPNTGAYIYVPDYIDAVLNHPGMVKDPIFTQLLAKQTFITRQVVALNIYSAVTHEVYHALTNLPDAAGLPYINFQTVSVSNNAGSSWHRFRRTQKSLEDTARTERGSDPTDNGNNLLRDP